MRPRPQVLEVWGDLACFSRPDVGKVERFSYPVITPSAARAIFEAIYWKPRFRWQVTRIELLSPPRYLALRRNEVKNRVPALATLERWMSGKEEPWPLWADGDRDTLGTDQEGRTQRQTMALKAVRYRLHAEIRPWPEAAHELPCLDAQFRRRARAGQCVYQPYFGCREFPAYFRYCEEDEREPAPFPLDMDLGWMLYDVFDLSRPGSSTDPPFVTLFRATLRGGVLAVPEFESDAVRKPDRRPAP